eukprot:179438_1
MFIVVLVLLITLTVCQKSKAWLFDLIKRRIQPNSPTVPGPVHNIVSASRSSYIPKNLASKLICKTVNPKPVNYLTNSKPQLESLPCLPSPKPPTAKRLNSKLPTAKPPNQKLPTAKPPNQKLPTAKPLKQKLSTATLLNSKLPTAKAPNSKLPVAKPPTSKLPVAKAPNQKESTVTAKSSNPKLPTA